MNNVHTNTIRALEVQPFSDGGESSLDEWYRSIRDTPLSDLPVGDVARLCRQRLYPDHVVPVAIKHLRENPMAGDMYDGELLVALKNVATDFWMRREDLRSDLSQILSKLNPEDLDDELIEDIERICKIADLV